MMTTYSKVWSLAALRLGFAVGPEAMIAEFEKTVLPYHLSAATQVAGCEALGFDGEMRERVGALVAERHRLAGCAIPETLDALPKELLAEVPLDLDGKPIRYRREKAAWVLWSVGLDLIDEVKPDAPMYPPKAGTRIADPQLATDWRWWRLNP